MLSIVVRESTLKITINQRILKLATSTFSYELITTSLTMILRQKSIGNLYADNDCFFMYYDGMLRKLTGTSCNRRLKTKKFYVLPTQCIYVFYVVLRTNSDYFPIQH